MYQSRRIIQKDRPYKKKQHPIPSKSSPKRSNGRACLCADGTYSIQCCDGSLIAQGIGNITGIQKDYVTYNGEFVTHNGEKVTHNG